MKRLFSGLLFRGRAFAGRLFRGSSGTAVGAVSVTARVLTPSVTATVVGGSQ